MKEVVSPNGYTTQGPAAINIQTEVDSPFKATLAASIKNEGALDSKEYFGMSSNINNPVEAGSQVVIKRLYNQISFSK